MLVVFSMQARASVDICSDPDVHSRLSAGFASFADSTFDQRADTIQRDNRDFDLLFTAREDQYLFGIGHRYRIFDIEPLPVASNGHLHTTFLPLHVQSGDDRRGFRVSAAIAMSASSNLYNNLDEFDSDALQWLAALVWGRQLSANVGLRYGFCGDHRFGEFQVYPAASIMWQPHPDWDLEFGFPDSVLRYRIADDFSSAIRLYPDGNEWYVLDRSLTLQSRFIYESFVLEWELDWRFLDRFTLTASIGRQFDNRYEMTLLDQSRIKLTSDPVTRVGATVEWRF